MSTFSSIRQHGAPAEFGDGEFFRRHGWMPVPSLVQWMVTLRCPLHCPHCLAADDGSPDMSLEQAASLIAQVAEMGVPEFLLTGGEPLSRPDLPEVIALLREHRVRWSLNTATTPSPRVKSAIEAWPPAFVAVSLDGPPEIHNRFRGRVDAFDDAMRSIAYFSALGVAVAAGTTVTRRNIHHLGATFGLVLASGATSWGLHLLVPEGRAARAKDLFLSRAQLRGLLAFATDKRKYFRITMADEIGYCGGWEPLVRDEPFFCGAGRAGCVVLPDGEVVPCTTLDRSASAGNITRRPLREIWENGFAELRAFHPEGKCAVCGYASACRGGCWLQRKNATQCFRPVWLPDQIRTLGRAAALVGVTSGVLGLAESSAAGPSATEQTERSDPPASLPAPASWRGELPSLLDTAIVHWYMWSVRPDGRWVHGPGDIRARLDSGMKGDTGAAYLDRWMGGKVEPDPERRADIIRSALKTKEPSLCLLGLIWRDTAEWCIDGPAPSLRSGQEQDLLFELLKDLKGKATLWHDEQIRLHLAPFENEVGKRARPFMISKAVGPMDQARSELFRKRVLRQVDKESVTSTIRPFGSTLTIEISIAAGTPFDVVDSKTTAPRKEGEMATFRMGLFDTLMLARKGAVGDPVRVTASWSEANASQRLALTLPEGVLLTHADLLRLADEQHEEELTLYARQRLQMANPFTLPAMRRSKDPYALMSLYLF